MNPHSGIDDNKKDNNNRTAKSIPAITLAGIVIVAVLLSGLSLINGYQSAVAQQNMTGNATTATTNATTATTGGGGGSANATAGNTTSATNATSAIGGGGIPSASEVREHIEEACMAAQSNDTEGVLLHLNLALNALGGNMTTSEGGGDEDEGGVTTGGGDEVDSEG
jgi:ABC-type lipoprotein release transport system permease subunit